MTELDSGGERLARCGSCGRRFRVPDAARRFRCKRCGGVVGAAEPEPAADAEAQAAERRQAQRELGRAYRLIRKMRLVLSSLAFLQGLAFLLALLAVLVALRGEGALAELPRGALYLWLGLEAAVLALLITAAARVVREPFAWTLVLALLQSLKVVLALLDGHVRVLDYAIAVALWASLVSLARVRQLVQQHPELYVSKRVRGEARLKPGDPGSSVRARAEERRAAEAAKRRTVGIAVGGTLVAVVALFLGWRVLNRPPGIETVTPGLVEAWNRSDIPAVASYWSDPQKAERVIERLVERREWGGLPRIERDELVDGARPRQRAETAVGTFELRWRPDGERWILYGIDPP